MFLLQKLRLMYACLSLNTGVSFKTQNTCYQLCENVCSCEWSYFKRGGKCSDDKTFLNSSLVRLGVAPGEISTL